MASAVEKIAREYYNPTGGGGARCWGATPAKDAPRKYWWSWRGIHVDPNAPVTNDELEELKDMLLGNEWSWGQDEGDTSTEDSDGKVGNATPSSSKSQNSTKTKTNWIDAASTEWSIMTAPPAPPSSTTGMKETTELLIDKKSQNDGEETVAGLAIAMLLMVLMFTLILGSWLKKREILYIHQAGAALLLGITGGVYMISQAYAQDLRSKDGLGGEKNWILTYGDYLVFDTEFFFLFLLPPIIFESGYAIDAEPFFRNLGKISYFAFIGTIIGSFVFGIGMYILGVLGLSYPFSFVNAMLFGSIIGATDPVTVLSIFTNLKVNPDLFAVVFGESVMNDAVAVVLYRAIYILEDTFTVTSFFQAAWAFVVVFLGSTAIGVIIALASALFFKRVKLSSDDAHLEHPEAQHVTHTRINHTPTQSPSRGNNTAGTAPQMSPLQPGKPVLGRSDISFHQKSSLELAVKGATLEASVVALFPWIAYMLAEALELVGIVSILFCGIVMGHYTRRNLSSGGRALSSGAFSITAQLSETFVFIYCGASVFLAQRRFFGTAFWTVVMCLLSRLVVVFPGVTLINRHSRRGGAGMGKQPVDNSDTALLLGGDDKDSKHDKGFGDFKSRNGVMKSCGFVTRKAQTFISKWLNSVSSSFFGGGQPIPENHARMLWFSGLRGAMAFALAMEAAAKRGEDGRAMLTSTLGAVLFTVLVVGGLTVPALKKLNIECGFDGSDLKGGGSSSKQRGTFDTRSERASDSTGNLSTVDSASSVLVNSEKDEGPALKRGQRRGENPGTFGSLDESDPDSRGFDFNAIDMRESFKFIDRQYITPMFMLEEENRDSGAGEGSNIRGR